jgi:glycosyltransferase involved in cell wall biosynthesis
VDVTICIASQRPDGLARLLESIGRLKRPSDLAFEVVVVHNAPQPSAAHELPDPGAAVRRFWEPRDNLSHARNRGVEQARGRWLAFVDDDEVVHEGWLAAYGSMLETCECDGFFGPVLPRFEPPANGWLDERFFQRERFASGTPITRHGARTGNAFVRRGLFDTLRFDAAFGRTGGEDWDLFRRMQTRGARFLWCDEARVDEFVPVERRCVGWLARRAFHGGSVYVRVEARTPAARRRHLVRGALGASAALLALPAAALRGRAGALRGWLWLCVQVGKLHGLLSRAQAGGVD